MYHLIMLLGKSSDVILHFFQPLFFFCFFFSEVLHHSLLQFSHATLTLVVSIKEFCQLLYFQYCNFIYKFFSFSIFFFVWHSELVVPNFFELIVKMWNIPKKLCWGHEVCLLFFCLYVICQSFDWLLNLYVLHQSFDWLLCASFMFTTKDS